MRCLTCYKPCEENKDRCPEHINSFARGEVFEPNLITLLALNAKHLYRSTLVGNRAPCNDKLHEEMTTLRPGDLVVETSSLGRSDDARQSIGRLIITKLELVPYSEPDEDDPYGYWDTFTYIETFDGELCRWSNCHFIRVLDHYFDSMSYVESSQMIQAKSKWVADALIRHSVSSHDSFVDQTPLTTRPGIVIPAKPGVQR